jgi:hypothetical protein
MFHDMAASIPADKVKPWVDTVTPLALSARRNKS